MKYALTAGSLSRVVLVVAIATAVACAPSGDEAQQNAGTESAAAGGGYTDVSAEQLNGLLAANDLVLVNVHTPRAGDIPETDLHIPYDEIEERTREIPGGKDARIVLYCRSGHMSARAAATLVSLGYTNVYNLVGGMQAWPAAGY